MNIIYVIKDLGIHFKQGLSFEIYHKIILNKF